MPKQPIILGATKTPTLVYACTGEPATWMPDGQAHQWMVEEAKKLGKDATHIRWNKVDQMHGFLTRGDMKGDLKLAQDVKAVMDGALQFATEHLA